MMRIDADSIFEVNGPLVISETIDDETVIINLDTGSYYSLRNAGPIVWLSLQQPATVSSLAAVLRTRFAIPHDVALREVEALASRLLAEGLIRSASTATEVQPHGELPVAAGAFVSPVLDKFTDMEAMLLLDPIHDVDEAGWPQLPGSASAGA